jgi:hypothetical protein
MDLQDAAGYLDYLFSLWIKKRWFFLVLLPVVLVLFLIRLLFTRLPALVPGSVKFWKNWWILFKRASW